MYIAQNCHERFRGGIADAEDGISDGSISDSVPKESSKATPELLPALGFPLGSKAKTQLPVVKGFT